MTMNCCKCHKKDLTDSREDVFGDPWCPECYLFWDPDGEQVAKQADDYRDKIVKGKYWWQCRCGETSHTAGIPTDCGASCLHTNWSLMDSQRNPDRQITDAEKRQILQFKSGAQ